MADSALDDSRESLFYLKSKPSLSSQLRDELANWPSLAPHVEAICELAQLSIILDSDQAWDGKTLGLSRLGGWPDLPPSIPYPTQDSEMGSGLLTFYCQLNLKELAPLQAYLPSEGWLYFFAADEECFASPTVLYHSGSVSDLCTYQPPDVEQLFCDSERWEPYPAFTLSIKSGWSLPSIYGASSERLGENFSHFQDLYELSYTQDPDPYSAVENHFRNPEKRYSSHIMNSVVFTQNESPEEQAALRNGGRPKEWMNLLTLNWDDRVGFSFWDAGSLTFSIPRKGLAEADFSNIHASLETS